MFIIIKQNKMKQIFLLFSLFLFSFQQSFSQQKTIKYFNSEWQLCSKDEAAYYREIEYDNDGKPQGFVRDFFMSGKLQWEGHLSADSPEIYEGNCAWYYENGLVAEKAYYIAGKVDGEFHSYYENGKDKEIYFCNRGILNGNGSSYYENGALYSTFTYKNNVLEGTVIDYFEDGKTISQQCVYVDGQLNGKCVVNYQNGKPQSISNYVDSIVTGQKLSYYESGIVQSNEMFMYGKLMGVSLYYYESGHLQSKRTYRDIGKVYPTSDDIYFYENGHTAKKEKIVEGFKQGEFSEYHENGNLSKKGFYKDDELDGEIVSYFETGEIKTKEQYLIGRPIIATEYSVYGSKYKESIFDSTDTYRCKIWSIEGRLQWDAHFVNGTLISYNDYDSKGNIVLRKIADSLLVQPAKSNSACLYGFKNVKEEWVVKPQFDMFLEQRGYFIVNKKDKFGVVDYSGKTVIPVEYENVEFMPEVKLDSYAGFDDDDNSYINSSVFFVVTKRAQKGIVNKNNKLIVPIEFDAVTASNNSYAILKKNDLYGFADTLGNVFAPKFGFITYFNDGGYALFANSDQIEIDYDKRQFGAINTKGEIIIPCEYNKINNERNFDLIWVSNNDNMGAYSCKGKKVLDLDFDAYDRVEFSADSVGIVTRNQQYGLVRYDGKLLAKANYDKIVLFHNTSPNYNCKIVAWLKKNNTWTAIDKQGNLKMKGKYDDVVPVISLDKMKDAKNFYKSLFIVKRNAKYGIIDDLDSIIVPIDKDIIYNIYDDNDKYTIVIIKNSSIEAYDSRNFYEKLDLKKIFYVYDDAERFCIPNSDYENHDYQCGVIAKCGKMILPPRYNISIFDNKYIVYTNEKRETGIMTFDGVTVFNPKTNLVVETINNGFATIITGTEKLGVFDLDQKRFVIDTVFDAISSYEQGYCWVKSKINDAALKADTTYTFDYLAGGWGIINANKKYVLPPIYDYPVLFDQYTAIVSKAGKLGLVDTIGKTLLPCIYKEIRRQENGMFMISNGKWGIADSSGKIIANPQWDDISSFVDNHAIIKVANKVGIIDSKAHVIVSPTSEDFSKLTTNIVEYFPSFGPQESPETVDEYGNKTYENTMDYDSKSLSRYGSGGNQLTQFTNDSRVGIIFNTIILAAMEDKLMSNSVRTCKYSYRTRIPIYYSDMSRGDLVENTCDVYLKKSDVDLIDITDKTFCYSVKTSITKSTNADGTISENTVFYNYQVRNEHELIPVSLDELFNRKYQSLLNSLIIQEVEKIDDVHLDCQDKSMYFSLFKDHFAITSDGLIFYHFTSSDLYSSDEEVNVTIPYSSLQKVINPKGVLASFIE